MTPGSLLDRVIPWRPWGSATAFPAIADAAQEVRLAAPAALAATAEKAKAELAARLRKRFTPSQSKALAIKVLNLCLAKRHFFARDTRLLSQPFGLVVDPSNACRLGCPGCVHSRGTEALHIVDWPNATLSRERFEALMEQYGPRAIGVYFCNYGEPLLNVSTPELIRAAKGYLVWTALSTSLSVQRFDAEAYVLSGLDHMALAIDGATQGVYERFRRGGNLECVLANLRSLVEERRRLARPTPLLVWNFLAFEHNAHEIPLACEMARTIGVDQFRVVNPFDVAWDDPEIRAAAVKARAWRYHWRAASGAAFNWDPFPHSTADEAIEQAFANPRWDAPADPKPSTPGHSCHWLYKNMVMDATGRILPCCGAPGPGHDLVFGRMDSTGRDVFNSEKFRQARAFFHGGATAGESSPHCAR